MVYVFRLANKATGKSVRIVTEKIQIPESVIKEMRRRILGAHMAQKIQERRDAVQASRKEK